MTWVRSTGSFAGTGAGTGIWRQLAFSPASLAWTAVGLLCIRLVKRDRDAAGFNSNPETQGPPLSVSAIAAILGVILGAVLAFGGGLPGRRLPWTETGCLEGGCGYFAFLLELFGLLAGAAAAALSLSGAPTIGPGPWGLTS